MSYIVPDLMFEEVGRGTDGTDITRQRKSCNTRTQTEKRSHAAPGRKQVEDERYRKHKGIRRALRTMKQEVNDINSVFEKKTSGKSKQSRNMERQIKESDNLENKEQADKHRRIMKKGATK